MHLPFVLLARLALPIIEYYLAAVKIAISIGGRILTGLVTVLVLVEVFMTSNAR